MIKKCACGASEKDFKIDIGPFYVDKCCIEAGYDELGKKVKKDLDLTGLPSEEEIAAEAAKLQPDLTLEPEDPPETGESTESRATAEDVQKALEVGGPTLETPAPTETAEEKKAREKAENKAKKDAEKAAKKAAEQAK